MGLKTIIVVMFLLISNLTISQSLRISINKYNVPFYFNTLDKYDDGIEYIDFAQIRVAFSEYGAPKDSNWQVQIKAINTVIDGSGTNILPLDRIRVKTTDGGSTTPATYSGAIPGNSSGWFELTTAYQDIVQDGPEGTYSDNIINVSWDCGTQAGKRVSGYASDLYIVDIDILVDVQ